jgi:hypothetical protein
MTKHDYIDLARNRIIDERVFNKNELEAIGKILYDQMVMLETLRKAFERYESQAKT